MIVTMTTGGVHPTFSVLRLALALLFLPGCQACPFRYRSSTTIRCSNLGLTAIPLTIPEEALTIRLEYNNLTKLAAGDFSRFSQLGSLQLYNNLIAEIEDGAFDGLAELKILQLESNNINRLTTLTFRGVPNLEELHLGGNQISVLPAGVFSPISALLYLSLAYNNLRFFTSEASQGLSSVEELYLSDNPLDMTISPSPFASMMALRDLRLDSLWNDIESEFTGPQISESVFDGLVQLERLDLSDNNLTRVPPAVGSLVNLTYLGLAYNFISIVDDGVFYELSLLQELDLAFNSLTAVPAAALSRLPEIKRLYLDSNPISLIPDEAFLRNTKLKTLRLSNAEVTVIQPNALVGLAEVDSLDISSSNVTTILDGAMDNVNPAAVLNLFDNHLRCDCHLRGFGNWLRSMYTGPRLSYPAESRVLACVTPRYLSGTAVVDVRPEEFACEPVRVVNTDGTVTASVGSDVVLPCGVEADPVADVYWMTSNRRVIYPNQTEPPFTLLRDSNSLSIARVDPTDDGSYTCFVSNIAGSADNSITLQVGETAGPSPSVSTSAVSITEIRPTKSSRRSGEGLLYGLAAGVTAVVIVLVISALFIVRRRRSSCYPQPKPNKNTVHTVPKPITGRPLPPIILDQIYEEIPPVPTDCQDCRETPSRVVLPSDRYLENPRPSRIQDTSFTMTERPNDCGLDRNSSPHQRDEIDHTYFTNLSSFNGPDGN